MRNLLPSSLPSRLVASALVSSFCGAAHGHIRLDEPTSRNPIPAVEDNSNLKDGPCGGGAGDTRTSDRDRISVFEPGETITVRWHETVHHASHYRISLDVAGQDDFADPVDETDIVEPAVLPVLLDGIPDISSGRDTFSVEVTLPDVTCDECTLQLTQYMYGRAKPMYYQCADLVIVENGEGTIEPVEPVEPGGEEPGGEESGEPSEEFPNETDGSGDSPESPVDEGEAVDGDEGEASSEKTGDSAGCSTITGTSPGSRLPWVLTLLALGLGVRRRKLSR